jgi:hypothetical protein
MAKPNFPYVLGFVGEKEVHQDNASALLEDLITAYRRNNKGSNVRFVIPIDPFTRTIDNLIDFCLTSGFDLELLGYADSFDNVRVQPYVGQAVEVLQIREGISLASAVVSRITSYLECRLILIADSEDSDLAYIALEAATKKNVVVRSLLNGLDRVFLTSDDEELIDMVVKNRDEEEEIEEEEDEEGEEDFDDDADEFDDDALDEPKEEDLDEDDEEIEDAEVIDEDDDDDVLDEDDEEPDEDDEEEDEPEEDSDVDEDDDVEDDDDDEEEEEMPKVTASPVKLTSASLTRLANKDRDAFYDLAAEHNVFPGRGMKVSMMVARILEGNNPAPAKKAPAKKVTAVKKAAPAKRTERPAPVAKKVPAKKAAAVSTKAPAKRVAVVGNTTVSGQANPNLVLKKTLTALGRSLLETAKSL